jgi:hypothetical protein
MCEEISRHLRHESLQVLGQQLQVIFVEENIGGGERRRYVEFHTFIHFVSYYIKHKLDNNDVRFLFSLTLKYVHTLLSEGTIRPTGEEK